MGDIGPLKRDVEFEPMPDNVPVEEPTPAPAPKPEPVPA
jgi:hypothetical protein